MSAHAGGERCESKPAVTCCEVFVPLALLHAGRHRDKLPSYPATHCALLCLKALMDHDRQMNNIHRVNSMRPGTTNLHDGSNTNLSIPKRRWEAGTAVFLGDRVCLKRRSEVVTASQRPLCEGGHGAVGFSSYPHACNCCHRPVVSTTHVHDKVIEVWRKLALCAQEICLHADGAPTEHQEHQAQDEAHDEDPLHHQLSLGRNKLVASSCVALHRIALHPIALHPIALHHIALHRTKQKQKMT